MRLDFDCVFTAAKWLPSDNIQRPSKKLPPTGFHKDDVPSRNQCAMYDNLDYTKPTVLYLPMNPCFPPSPISSLLTFYHQPPPNKTLGVDGQAPRCSYSTGKCVIPTALSGIGPTADQLHERIRAVIHARENSQCMPEVNTSQAVIGRMLPILHATRPSNRVALGAA